MLPSIDRTARDTAYLTLAFLTSIAAFTVWVLALSLSLSLALLIVGLPVVIGAAYVIRWTAELDRRNAALVFGRPVRGTYHSHRAASFGERVLAVVRDPQVWRDLAWLITHSVLGFAFGTLAIALVAAVGGLATLPLWYWSIPGGVDFGAWNVHSLPWALISALAAVPAWFVTVWALRAMAKFHASVAAELLGRY
jgi:hypothetical protein